MYAANFPLTDLKITQDSEKEYSGVVGIANPEFKEFYKLPLDK